MNYSYYIVHIDRLGYSRKDTGWNIREEITANPTKKRSEIHLLKIVNISKMDWESGEEPVTVTKWYMSEQTIQARSILKDQKYHIMAS